jgi:hypothetical protein
MWQPIRALPTKSLRENQGTRGEASILIKQINVETCIRYNQTVQYTHTHTQHFCRGQRFAAKATCVMFSSWIIAVMQNFTYQLMEIQRIVLTAVWGYSAQLWVMENLYRSFHTTTNGFNSPISLSTGKIYRHRTLAAATSASRRTHTTSRAQCHQQRETKVP